MNSHTPAPWTLCTTMLGPIVMGWHVAASPHGSSLPVCVSDKFSDSRDQKQEIANARLIAAAPDLLESLKETIMHMVNATLEHCDGNKCREQWCIGCFGEESANAYVETANKAYSKAIAVINKATGATQ